MATSRIVQRRNEKYSNASSTLCTVNNLKLGCCLPLILVVVIIQDVWNHTALIELDNNNNNSAASFADSTIHQNLLLWTLSEYWTRDDNGTLETGGRHTHTSIEREKSTKTSSTALAAATTHGTHGHHHHQALRNDDDVLLRQGRSEKRNDSNNNDTLSGGAIGMDGEVGYVPDNISPRLLTKSSNLNELFQDACRTNPIHVEGKGGHQVLSKVQVVQATTNSSTTTKSHLPRLLCMVYTYSKSRDNLQAIVDTWSDECDGFLAASNETLPSLGAINIVHQGPESYQNMWQKVRSMWSYVYDHYYEDYDYFHMCVQYLCTEL